MNGFLRSFVLGLAMLFVAQLALISTVAMAGGGPELKERLRAWVLSEEERRILKEAHNQAPEPAMIRREYVPRQEEFLQALVEQANASQINEMVKRYQQRQEGLDEREALVTQQEQALRITRADLMQRQRELRLERERLEGFNAEIAQRRDAFAREQREIESQLDAISEVEMARMQELARRYEAMKDDAWEILRNFSPREIARIVVFMSEKAGARLLKNAAEDEQKPNYAAEIHRALLTLDVEGRTGDQVERLARLYRMMKPDNAASYMLESTDEEIVRLLNAIQRIAGDKAAASITVEMMRQDPARTETIQRMLGGSPLARGGGQ